MIGSAFLRTYRLATWRTRSRFIILAQGRTGSTMLTQRLDSHPDVKAKGELLHPSATSLIAEHPFVPGMLRPRFVRDLTEWRDRDPCAFLETFGWRTLRPWHHTAGFKALWYQILELRNEDRRRLFSNGELRVIWLERRDLLGQYISGLAAEKAGWYHLSAEEEHRVAPAVTLSPDNFFAFVGNSERQAEVLRAQIAHLPMLSLIYEDLIADREQENERLCTFLGIRVAPLRDQTRKIAVAPLNERVVNFEEFASALRGTRFAAYLVGRNETANGGQMQLTLWRPVREMPENCKDSRLLWWALGAGYPFFDTWQELERGAFVADAVMYWADIPRPPDPPWQPIASLPEDRKNGRYMLWFSTIANCCQWDEISPIAGQLTHWADVTRPDGGPVYDEVHTTPTASI